MIPRVLVLCMAAFFLSLAGCIGLRPARHGSDHVPRTEMERVLEVAWPLFRVSSTLCPFDPEPTYGFEIGLQQGNPMGTAAEEDFARPSIITAVYASLPAQAAGVPVGAVLLYVNEESVGHLGPEEVTERITRAALAKIEPLSLSVLYVGHVRDFNLQSVNVCRFDVRRTDAEIVNAFSDGHRVTITRGMLDFVADEHELAFVLAHEIAHNVLEHQDALKFDSIMKRLSTALMGIDVERDNVRDRRDLEMEADWLGLTIVTAAQYDPEAALRLITRLSDRPGRISENKYVETHPSNQARLAALQKSLALIGQNGPTGGK